MKLKHLYTLFFCFIPFVSFGQATLIAHWDFNGTTNDVTGNGLNGNGTNITSTTGFSGQPNTAYSFNGTNSKIDVPYNPLMNLSSWSITALIKPTGYYQGACQANYLLSRGHEYSSDYYALYFLDNPYDQNCNAFTPDSEVVEAMPAGTNLAFTPQFASGQFVHLNNWYCIASTYANDTIRVYINGNFSVAVYWANQYGPPTTADMSIGYYNYGLPGYPYWYNGVIDDMRLYSGALSQFQLDSLCNVLQNNIDTTIVYDFTDTVACNTATFTANYISGNTATQYAWTFGDNTSGTTNPVTHVYSQSGTYNVTLIVTDSAGHMDTITHQVTVSAGNFNYSIGSVVQSCKTVQLSANYISGDTANQFTWIYGDNTPAGNGNMVTHTYSQYGNYTISLVVSNVLGCIDTFTLPVSFSSNFNYSIADSQVNCSTVKLTATHINGDTTTQYLWLFSDNTTATGNPVTHNFNQSGTFSADLVVTNNQGCTDTFTHSFSLHANVNYTVTDSVINCKTVQLTANYVSGDIATQFLWLFSDNTTATGNPVTHSFGQNGTYSGSLVISDGQGCTDTVPHSFTLPFNADYSISDSVINCRTTQLTATYISGDVATQFLWLFSDSSTATGNPAIHMLSQNGTYDVSLVLSNNLGCMDTSSHTFTLPVMINYSISDSTIDCKTSKLEATYVSGDTAAEYFWLFPGFETASGNPIIHTFPTSGMNTAALVLTNDLGCKDTVSYSFTNNYQLFADFTFEPITPERNRPTHFYNTSSPLAIKFHWDFGDGTSSEEENPVKQYTLSGTYHVCLTATDSNGCFATACKDVLAEVTELIDIPDAFSPNGDGKNDILFARGYGIKTMTFVIYNRWGQKIFTSTDLDKGWDGTYKGTAQPPDAYTYILDAVFQSGRTFHKQGNVTILR